MNAAPNSPQLAKSREIAPETLSLVHSYIKTTRGWQPDAYELEFLDERSGLLFIFIGYKQETKDPSRLGSDKSFYVGFDEKKMTVVQEGKLQ